MIKNFINRFKNLVEQNKDNKLVIQKQEVASIENNENNCKNEKKELNELKNEIKEDSEKEKYNNITVQIKEKKYIEKSNIKIHQLDELTQEDIEYIKQIKIKRAKSIKAVDVYTKKPQIFNTYKECSKTLNIPIEYIQENLKYGNTDYLGSAIKYLSKELNIYTEENKNYLDSNKTPSQILEQLNNKIFTSKISEEKRNEILCNENIEPIKMHYIFECIDEEYDDYFKIYKSIIKRGGKKKIELVDKKGEVIDIFKSLDECANFIKKEKNEVVDMLKYKNTKVGRNEIRYSLRNI